MTLSDIIYRVGITLTALLSVFALWLFSAGLWDKSLPPWQLLPPGVTKEEFVQTRATQLKWAGVEAAGYAAFRYAATRALLSLVAWFRRGNSS